MQTSKIKRHNVALKTGNKLNWKRDGILIDLFSATPLSFSQPLHQNLFRACLPTREKSFSFNHGEGLLGPHCLAVSSFPGERNSIEVIITEDQ